jgi:hypothetical protein
MVLEIRTILLLFKEHFMPWSADENRDWVLSHVSRTDRVLDVGAGAGIWSDLLRSRVSEISAVEIFEPYLERFGLWDKYDNIYLGDFKDLTIPYGYFNTVILGDVLEHFEMEDALKVWEKARLVAGPKGQVLLSTPIVEWPQGEAEGNPHEAHLSFFPYEALEALSGVEQTVKGELIGSVRASGLEAPTAPITVVIPTIAGRQERLNRAVQSVYLQTLRPQALIISEDTARLGAPANRDSGVNKVVTPWVALLDDDDYFYPDHLDTLYQAAVDTDADIVYSWFDVEGGTDPFPENFGKPWNPDAPVQTTVTILAKTDVIRKVGGYSSTSGLSEEELERFAQGNTVGEDFRLVANASDMGAKIVHVAKRTWAYVHHGFNTSGRPDRW